MVGKDSKEETAVQPRKRRRSAEDVPKITAADLNELKTYGRSRPLACMVIKINYITRDYFSVFLTNSA